MNRVQIYTQAVTLSEIVLLLNATVKKDKGQTKFLQIICLYLQGVFAQPISKLDLCAKLSAFVCISVSIPDLKKKSLFRTNCELR